jgi:hypothetical protein
VEIDHTSRVSAAGGRYGPGLRAPPW